MDLSKNYYAILEKPDAQLTTGEKIRLESMSKEEKEKGK